MTIEENLAEFHGLPVRNYVPGEGLPDAGAVAWRLRRAPDGPPFLDGLLRPFLAEPSVGHVQALVLGTWVDDLGDSSAPLVDELVGSTDRLPALRALFLGDVTGEECDLARIRHGDVTGPVEALTALEEYGVRGGSGEITMRPFASASLRRLTFQSDGLPVAVVRAVGASDLPNLEHLELWLGAEEASIGDLQPILAGDRFPALQRLGLRNAEIADEVATALATAPVVRQIAVLDLSLGTLGDEGVTALLRGQPLAHLALLDLHHHYLSDDGMAYVRASGLTVDLSDQQVEVDGERYVAVAE
jgi:hypothetical protein